MFSACCVVGIFLCIFIRELIAIYPYYDVPYLYLPVLNLEMNMPILPSEMCTRMIWALSSIFVMLLTFSILSRASHGVFRRVMCSCNVLVYMVPFGILGLYICIFIRTLLTIFPDYNVPLTDLWSLPLPDLGMKILPSMILTLVIWVLLSFVSLVLFFSMPWRASYGVFRRKNNKFYVLINAIIALVLELFVFLFVYNVYAVELVSFLQLILFFPLLTFVMYSFFQGYILSLDLYGAFSRFHIAIRILFNGVTILHGFCLIAVCIFKLNGLSNAVLAIIGLVYRFWVATKYTKLLRRPRAEREQSEHPCLQHPSQDGDDGDLALPHNNPGDHFYQDKDDGSRERYQPQKSDEDKSYNKSNSILVVNYNLFCTYLINLTHEQIIKLAVGFFMTVLYLLLCYMFVLFFSTYANISIPFISIINDTMVTFT